jgi:hypothetical protein
MSNPLSPEAWAQVSDAVDGMVEVAREANLTTAEFAKELLDSQLRDCEGRQRDVELRLMMMAAAAATAIQRLAGWEAKV